MKAISAIIAIILILMIVVTIASLFWIFMSGLFTGITETGKVGVTKIREDFSSCMLIDSINENKIYLRNCGDGVIESDSLKIYIVDVSYDFVMTPSTINNGEFATIDLFFFGINPGDYYLKITSPSREITQLVEAYLPDSSLVVDLSFDEGYVEYNYGINNDNITFDKTSFHNDGYLNDSNSGNSDGFTLPQWIKGKNDKAFQFDGSDDYIGIWDSQSIRINDTIQVEAWIKTSDRDGVRMSIANRFDGSLDQEQGWLLFLTEQGKLRFHIGNNTADWAEVTGTSDLRDGNWHHVIGNYNMSIIQVFVDGNLEDYAPFSDGIWNETATSGVYGMNVARRCSVCGGAFGSLFNGTMDEIKVYRETAYPFKTLCLRVK